MSTFPNCCLDPVAHGLGLDRLDVRLDLLYLRTHQDGDKTRSPAPTESGRSFWSRPLRASELTEREGVKPLRRIEDLRADFWPDDESIDDFIATIRRWRSEGG
jgi:hypothetical protein